jgi:hypothetical protein
MVQVIGCGPRARPPVHQPRRAQRPIPIVARSGITVQWYVAGRCALINILSGLRGHCQAKANARIALGQSEQGPFVR